MRHGLVFGRASHIRRSGSCARVHTESGAVRSVRSRRELRTIGVRFDFTPFHCLLLSSISESPKRVYAFQEESFRARISQASWCGICMLACIIRYTDGADQRVDATLNSRVGAVLRIRHTELVRSYVAFAFVADNADTPGISESRFNHDLPSFSIPRVCIPLVQPKSVEGSTVLHYKAAPIRIQSGWNRDTSTSCRTARRLPFR